MADPTALEIETLTYTILGEARGEGVDGMSMVANVIRNRAESGLYSSNPYDVALEPSQFSTHNAKGGNQTSTRAEVPKGSALYSQAETIVRDVIYGDNPGDPTGGSLYYHTKDVSPTWAPKVKTSYGTITQGAHIYYPRHPVPPKDIPTGPSIVDIRAGGKLPDGKAIKPTPFSKQRGGEIQGVVFHHTVGSTLKSALASAGKTGAQYYIDRDGQIYQYASDETRVAHMQFPGSQYRTDIDQPTAHLGNDNTLGVEIVAMDENDITPEQKEAAAALAYHLANKYAIPADMIVGHGQLQGTAPNGNKRLKEGVDPAEYARGFIVEGKIPPALAAIEGAMGGRATAAGWKIDNMMATPKSSEDLWQRMAATPTIDDLTGGKAETGSAIAREAAARNIADAGFGSLRGSQGALMQQALDRQFVDTVTPTIDQAIAMEGPSTLWGRTPVAYFAGDSLAARDPLGLSDRGIGSLVNLPQDSAERRIYEARREQQYQVAQVRMAEATRSAQMTYGAMGQDIGNVMGSTLPDEIDGVPRVTEEDLFGPAFAPQTLDRPLAAPGEGLTQEQAIAMRFVPKSQIIVNSVRPDSIGADGGLRGSPNNGFVTPLSRQEEAAFREWKAAVAPDDSGLDYDYRGAFKAGVMPDDAGHWPDTFKKPNHPTFSTDSQYAPFAPALAGTWRDDVYIPAPKRMSVTLDEALTPRAILDRISTDAKRRREAEEESPTTTSAPARSVVEDVPRETVVTQDQAEVMISDARRTALVAPQFVAPRPTSADMFAPSTSPQVMGRLSPTIPATFTAPRLTASEAFGAAVAPQRMGRLDQPTVLVAPTLTRAEMFGAAISPQRFARPNVAPGANLTDAQIRAMRATPEEQAATRNARLPAGPEWMKTGMLSADEAARDAAIRRVVAPTAPPTIPRYVSTPPATPPKLTPIRVGTSYGIPPTPAARPAAKPVSVSGVVKDVTTRLGSVGSTLKTLGNSVQGEVRRVTGQTPTTPPLPKADPRPVAVPPAAKTSAPGAGLTKDQRNAMSALPTVALEVKPAKVSTATVTPQKPPSGKPPVVKQAEQAAQVKKQREAAAPKPAPRPAVTPVPRAAPSTVAPRRSVVQWGRTAPTVRAVGANGAIRSVVAPNGGTVTMGRNGPLNSFTQSSAWWQGQVLGNGGDSNYTNEGISGDGRYGGGGSLSGSV
jgi:N-acetylmuramoyl-L-alanine amidase